MLLTMDNFDSVYNEFIENKLVRQMTVNYRIRMEFTLCHPHTKPWLQYCLAAKRACYRKWLKDVNDRLPHGTVARIEFETVNQDHMHAHGYFEFESTTANACAYCVQLTNMWLFMLPKRYDHCLKGSTYDNYNAYTQRIAIPQCCIQFRSYEKKRAEYWENYISKDIV